MKPFWHIFSAFCAFVTIYIAALGPFGILMHPSHVSIDIENQYCWPYYALFGLTNEPCSNSILLLLVYYVLLTPYLLLSLLSLFPVFLATYLKTGELQNLYESFWLLLITSPVWVIYISGTLHMIRKYRFIGACLAVPVLIQIVLMCLSTI